MQPRRLNTDLIKKGLRLIDFVLFEIGRDWTLTWSRRDWDHTNQIQIAVSRLNTDLIKKGLRPITIVNFLSVIDWTLTWSRRDWEIPPFTVIYNKRLNTDLIKKGLRLWFSYTLTIFHDWTRPDQEGIETLPLPICQYHLGLNNWPHQEKGIRDHALPDTCALPDWTLTWSRRDWDDCYDHTYIHGRDSNTDLIKKGLRPFVFDVIAYFFLDRHWSDQEGIETFGHRYPIVMLDPTLTWSRRDWTTDAAPEDAQW